jgi:hypothetical protein
LPAIPLSLWIFWTSTSLVLVYLAVMSARGRQRGRPLQAYAIVASILVLLLAVGGNMLVLAGRLDSVFR